MSNLLQPSEIAIGGESERPLPHIPDRQKTSSATTGRLLIVSGIVYFAVSLLAWWNIWSEHPTTTTLCGCGDPSLFTWFLAWPAHAILHGQNLFYSAAMLHPHGVNLLSNTSELAIGVLLAPVTWIFGPIATLNVALLLSPVANALAMCALLRRWTRWAPAAFIGGLAYGFTPFLLLNLTGGYFMISMAAVPPLMLLCLDELLIRQRHSPIAIGVLLGLLVAFEFFIGTETLLIIAISLLIGLILLVAYAALRSPTGLRAHFHHAAIGIGWWAATSVVLLSYPLWFTLAGPAHLSGPIWPNLSLQYGGADLKQVLFPTPAQLTKFAGFDWNHAFGGYQGAVLSTQYVGLGLVLVLAGGIIAFHRDMKIWLFGLMSAISLLLSFGASRSFPLPWQLLAHLPQFDNVIPERFLDITWLTAAVLVGLIVDHTYWEVDRWSKHRTSDSQTGSRSARVRSRLLPAIAAGLVAIVALAQPAAYMSQDLPFTAEPVVLPTWFEQVAPHLDQRQVLLVIPSPSSLRISAATWQAVDSMAFSMVEGPGPGAVPSRAGAERAGATVLADVSFASDTVQSMDTISAAGSLYDETAVRTALRGWGVTKVVIPDQPELPTYTQIPSVTVASALIAAATGEKPLHQADAWVWNDVTRAASATPTAVDLAACVKGLPIRGIRAVEAATNCAIGKPS